jgi:CHAT domain-containing protein
VSSRLIKGSSECVRVPRIGCWGLRKLWPQGLMAAVVLTATLGDTAEIIAAEHVKVQLTQARENPSAVKRPPRSAKDVLAILDRFENSGRARFEALRTKANATEPEFNSPRDKAAFLRARAGAARQLGRAEQEIADLSQVVTVLASLASEQLLADAQFSLGLAHLRAGDFAKGRNIIDAVLKSQRSFADHSASRVERFVRDGEFLKAREVIAETDDVLETLPESEDFNADQKVFLRMALLQGKASLLDLMGDLREAEDVYQTAIAAWTGALEESGGAALGGGKVKRIANLLKIRLADNLRGQGRYVDSELISREALIGTLKLNGRYSHQAASVLRTLAQTIFDQRRYFDAILLVREVLSIYDKSGLSAKALNRLIARQLLADILATAGDWDGAWDQFKRLHHDLGDATALLRDRFLTANLTYARALLENGDAATAHDVLVIALARAGENFGPEALETWEAGGLLAVAKAEIGSNEDARRLFVTYVPPLMARRAADGETASPIHDARAKFIAEAYLRQLANSGAAESAMKIADGLRGRRLMAAISSSVARAAAKDGALANLVRRAQDGQTQRAALQRLLSGLLSSTARDDASVTRIRRQLKTVSDAVQGLFDDIERRFPDYAELVRPRPSGAADARPHLSPDEALISIYTSSRETFVWVARADGAVAAHVARIGAGEMAETVDHLREALDPGFIPSLDALPRFDVALAHDLYAALLEPLREHWSNAARLIFVTEGNLASLPLSILPTAPVALGPDDAIRFSAYRAIPWLARDHAITMLPSIASLTSLRGGAPVVAAEQPFIGFGDPYFSLFQLTEAESKNAQVSVASGRGSDPARSERLRSSPNTRAVNSATLAKLPRLYDTAAELKSVARSFNVDPARHVYLGSRADEGTVKSLDLGAYRVISFATHGLVAGDLDGLDEPALALSAPEVTGNSEDGLLTMSEILGLRLNAEWTVLSACNTAAADGEGAEAVSGLGRAFFYAGSRALLVSNWPVHSAATTALMTTLFRTQAEHVQLSRAQALQNARKTLIDQSVYKNPKGRVVFSYAHPLFWAPFTLIGDG